MILTFEQWLKTNRGVELPQEGEIPMSWFYKMHLPPVIKCSHCEMSMVVFSAYIDELGNIYCHNCADSIKEE